MSVVMLFGNGLSCGFDGRLATRSITARVLERLGPAYVRALEGLAELGRPEPVDPPLGVDRGGFEQLAGPVDRIAEAMTAIQALLASTDATVLDGLRAATEELRLHYLRIVGTVLSEVDACCVDRDADEGRRAAWERMNDFADALIAVHRRETATVFTVNYDSLLMSAMLNSNAVIYDGFRYGSLNVPLARWQNSPALYHLHGSVSWIRTATDSIEKPSLEYVRAVDAVDEWAAGRPTEGWPSVILGDLKSRQAARFPFALFYGELRSRLEAARLAVVGGYSFGDTPVNRELARFLARNESSRLLVWSRSPNHKQILDRLQVQLVDEGDVLEPHQVAVEQVELPNRQIVDDVKERI